MNGGLSIHCVDIWRGLPAAGMQIEVFQGKEGSEPVLLCDGKVATTGVLDDPRLNHIKSVDEYVVHFHVADYYRSRGFDVGKIPYLDVVRYRFRLLSPETHYHFPFKTTPWGYSLFITTSRAEDHHV